MFKRRTAVLYLATVMSCLAIYLVAKAYGDQLAGLNINSNPFSAGSAVPGSNQDPHGVKDASKAESVPANKEAAGPMDKLDQNAHSGVIESEHHNKPIDSIEGAKEKETKKLEKEKEQEAAQQKEKEAQSEKEKEAKMLKEQELQKEKETKEKEAKEKEAKEKESKEKESKEKESKEKEAVKSDGQKDSKIPLYKKYNVASVDPAKWEKMSLKERVQNRHERHNAYLKALSECTNEEKKEENDILEKMYYGMEWEELKTFEKPIEWKPEDYVDGAIQPAGNKVLVLSANDGKGNDMIGGVMQATSENRKEYCAYHGYVEYFVNLTKYAQKDRHPVWAKVDAIREAFDENPQVEWVWWLDTDALITNAEIDLAKHFLNKRAMAERLAYGRPLRNNKGKWTDGIYMEKGEVDIDNIDVVIAQDFYGLNAGSMFFRRSQFTMLLLDFWQDSLQVNSNYERREQDALVHIFFEHEQYQRHFGLAPQRILNAYTTDPTGVWTWREGDLAVHLAGCYVNNYCETMFHRYWNKRIQVPKEFQLKDRIDLDSVKVGKETYTKEG